MVDHFPPKPKWLKPAKTYDFMQVHNQLKKIYETILARLEKEPQKPLTFFLIAYLLKFSYQTYRVTTRLVSETADERFPLQAHSLSRSVIDAAFTVTALLDNPENTRKYEIAGYKKFWESLKKEESEGYINEPGFKEFYQDKKEELKKLAQFLNLTAEEIANPQKISYWPIPGQMIRKKNPPLSLRNDRADFLQEIYKWHYDDPSGVSHADWIGLAMAIFAAHPEKHWEPGKYESDAVYTCMLFLLIMLSEIEITKNYGYKENLRKLWELLGGVYWEVGEYYKKRYEKLLKSS